MGVSRPRRHTIRPYTIARRSLPWLAVLGTAALTAECADPAHAAPDADLSDYPLPDDPAGPYTRDEILWLIDSEARSAGVSAWLMRDIAWHESRYDPEAYNRRSQASGIFQFIPSTWASARAVAWNGFWRQHSPFHAPANISVAAWVISQPYPWGPRHWGRR